MHLDFWFDYSCPYAYLGSTQIEALAARAGASLTLRPMLLGGVFKANDTPQNLMNVLSPAKARHNGMDMMRWAELFGVPLAIPSGHPLRTVEALRATLVTGVDPEVVHGFFGAYWREGRAPSDPQTIRDVVSAAGHDADAVLARIAEPAIKEELRRRTDEAVALGIFGAPALVIDGQRLYWGQDRLHFALGIPLEPARPTETRRMAKHTLEIYWDFSSPFSYLGATQAEALAARTGAELVWRPMLLGGVFKAIGQADAPIMSFSDAKRRHYLQDLTRWAEHWGVPFSFPTRFPMNTVKALRAYLVLPEARRKAYREATYRAYWAEDRDISSDEVLRELIGAGADEVLAKTQDPAIKQELMGCTQRAVDAGVFGAPTWVIDGEDLYWGQDRMPLVELALKK